MDLRGILTVHRSEEGATAVEYGIMVALIAVVILAAVWGVGQTLASDFDCVSQHVANTPGNPSGVSC